MSITCADHGIALSSDSSHRSLVVLGIDTASPKASYAVARDGVLAAVVVAQDDDRPSETLFTNVAAVLDKAGAELSHVDLFCAIVGPGSFTGLRVSLAAIEGIAQTLRMPALGYDTFEATALAARRRGTILPVISAGRGEVYAGLRVVGSGGSLIRLGEDSVGSPEDVLRRIVTEEGRASSPLTIVANHVEVASEALGRLESQGFEVIRSVSISLAAAIAEHATAQQLRPLRPYYLRKPDARS